MVGIIILMIVIFLFLCYGITQVNNPVDKLYKKIEKSFDESVRDAANKSKDLPPLQFEMVKLAILMTRSEWERYYYQIPNELLDSLEKKGMNYFDMLDDISNRIGAKYVSEWRNFKRREREEQYYKDMEDLNEDMI